MLAHWSVSPFRLIGQVERLPIALPARSVSENGGDGGDGGDGGVCEANPTHTLIRVGVSLKRLKRAVTGYIRCSADSLFFPHTPSDPLPHPLAVDQHEVAGAVGVD